MLQEYRQSSHSEEDAGHVEVATEQLIRGYAGNNQWNECIRSIRQSGVRGRLNPVVKALEMRVCGAV